MNHVRWFSIALLTAASGCASTPKRQRPHYDIRYPPSPDPARVIFLAGISNDVDFGRKPAPLRQLIFGVDDRPVKEIGKPFGVCTWDDQLLLCDTQHRVVHVLDFGAREMVPLGSEGPVQLVKPVDVACDEAGFRYVADAARGEVVVFDTAGRFVRRMGTSTDEDPFKPVALAIRGGKAIRFPHYPRGEYGRCKNRRLVLTIGFR